MYYQMILFYKKSVFYKVTPLFFLMPRIRLYKMLFHLIYLKTSVLYKMLVEKYRFQKNITSLQSEGEQGQFSVHFEVRKRYCTGGQPTPKGRGNLNPYGNLWFPADVPLSQSIEL